MSDADREKWDQKYRAGAGTSEPSGWLVALAEAGALPREGSALDVAGGAGRNAAFLAARGLEVTVCDVSPVGLALAWSRAPVATLEIDLEREPLPEGPWDLILDFHYLERRLFPQFAGALAPGGLLVVCHPTLKNLERHSSPGAQYLLAEGELPSLVKGLEVVSYQEGWLDEGRHEARLVARHNRHHGAFQIVSCSPPRRALYGRDMGPGAVVDKREPLVLVVEDYEDSRAMYTELLELAGYRVVQAGDGLEAVSMAGELLPDLILMDLSLPGIDGREATRRLKENPRTSRIPIIVLSGMPSGQLKGAWDDYVGKPCSPETLMAAMRRVLEQDIA